MKDCQKYWFPAKPPGYGWGWGLPITWQGWAVFISFFALVIAGGIWLAPRNGPVFSAYMALISALLVAVCMWKGEPQHSARRSGDKPGG